MIFLLEMSWKVKQKLKEFSMLGLPCTEVFGPSLEPMLRLARIILTSDPPLKSCSTSLLSQWKIYVDSPCHPNFYPHYLISCWNIASLYHQEQDQLFCHKLTLDTHKATTKKSQFCMIYVLRELWCIAWKQGNFGKIRFTFCILPNYFNLCVFHYCISPLNDFFYFKGLIMYLDFDRTTAILVGPFLVLNNGNKS